MRNGLALRGLIDQEAVIPSMDILSDSAKRIGAVNTVTKQPDGKLHGDNTDWLGIKNQFESRLLARGGWAPATTTARRGTVAMLCGAGGTAKAAAYCFEQMGCSHVIIMNRTLSRAETLAGVSAASIGMRG
jgi:pentafunctional AROM polypeptide